MLKNKIMIIALIGAFVSVACSKSSENKTTDVLTSEDIAQYTSSPLVSIPQSIFPNIGNTSAPIKFDVFLDVWCPACRIFEERMWEVSKNEKYKDLFEVRYHLFPLVNSFPDDIEASLLHIEMAKRDRYTEFRDKVVKSDIKRLNEMLAAASQLVGQEITIASIDNEINRKILQSQQETGQNLKLSHTPTVFLNNREIPFTPSVEQIKGFIDYSMSESK